MAYAYVENNQVKEIHEELPSAWQNVSGFDKLANDLPSLKQYGWYFVEPNAFAVDGATQKITEWIYEINDTSVRKIPVCVPLTEQEIIEKQNQSKQIFLSEVRKQRDELLQQTDWTQLPDVQSVKTEQWKQQWLQYRTLLRDITEQYKNLTDFTDITISWPTIPEK